jgi:hypothetical protein
MIEKSAERGIEVPEPTHRGRAAALTRTMSLPPPANDNALPLSYRLSLAAGAAALLAVTAALAHFFG